MENNIVEKIMELNKKIDSIAMKTTSSFRFGQKQNLNYYDKQVLQYYKEIVNLIVEIAEDEEIKDVGIIDKKYFKKENNVSMILESYMSVLQFYRNIDKNINKIVIEVINKIENDLKLDKYFEIKNRIELADCYFQIGNEEKAIELILDFIQNNPDEDEAYQVMQNWYMYDKPDINKLAKVIDLAEENKHILITDFGYDKLVNFYKSIGNDNNKQKYEELYNKWKKNRKIIDF